MNQEIPSRVCQPESFHQTIQNAWVKIETQVILSNKIHILLQLFISSNHRRLGSQLFKHKTTGTICSEEEE